jgi:hypothetical protein
MRIMVVPPGDVVFDDKDDARGDLVTGRIVLFGNPLGPGGLFEIIEASLRRTHR